MIDDWATHLPSLLACVAATDGPILECGTGEWSTPLLHALCAPSKRALTSLDSNPAWIERFRHLEAPWHELRLVNWDDLTGGPWSVALIDHGAVPRGPVVAALRDRVRFLVLHDSECSYCGYTEALRAFDWCWTHILTPTWTTIAGMGEPPSWLADLIPGRFGIPEPNR